MEQIDVYLYPGVLLREAYLMITGALACKQDFNVAPGGGGADSNHLACGLHVYSVGGVMYNGASNSMSSCVL